jgi:hypothetical protein
MGPGERETFLYEWVLRERHLRDQVMGDVPIRVGSPKRGSPERSSYGRRSFTSGFS